MTSPMSNSGQPLAPGTYKFVVNSTDEAVALLRERLGPNARVLSVRPLPARGWLRFFRGPRLEIIAAAEAPSAASRRGRTPLDLASSEPAVPDETAPDGRAAGGMNLDPGSKRAAMDLTALLRRSGITETTLERLQGNVDWAELNRLPLHRALAETSRLLCAQVEPRNGRSALSRAAFLGAAGVGRTTVLCKLLAHEVFRRARFGHVVAVEFEQPNPLGPLTVFSEALGVPLVHYPCETEPAVPGGFVFFDLPAIAPGRGAAANAALAEFLDREAIAQRILVLNAAYDRASLREAHATGRALGATHLVFTHLDEVPQWGKLWDYVFDESLEPLFLTTGPSLTGDCEDDVTGALARRTLPSASD